MDFISQLSIFVLAVFVGYYVVWSVTPALHTPLMSVTNAISSVIIVGALIAGANEGWDAAKWIGLGAVVMASINIFGGFAVTERMLAMYKKKGGDAAGPQSDAGKKLMAAATAALAKGKEAAAKAQEKIAEKAAEKSADRTAQKPGDKPASDGTPPSASA